MLIKLCSASAKQNAAVNGSDACSLMINFEQVIKSLLVWNFYFTFFLPFVDSAFLLEYWKYSRPNIAQTSSLCYVAGF